MSAPSQPTSGTALAVPPTPAAQSPQGASGEQPPPPKPSASATHPAESLVPNAGHQVTPPVGSALQAAQLEHKPSTTVVPGPTGPSNCALAGGAAAPQSPVAESAPPPAKKRRRKRRDNHVSVRFDTDEDAVITRRMEQTGETQSQAVRAIIRESEHKMGHVFLAPKAPPEELEALLGVLAKWRKDFASAKPRLNIATPTSDAGRYAEVQKWRKEADRLLAEIPTNETAVTAAMRAVTSLTPARVATLKGLLTTVKGWRKAREEKGETRMANAYHILIELIEDMGITEEGGK